MRLNWFTADADKAHTQTRRVVYFLSWSIKHQIQVIIKQIKMEDLFISLNKTEKKKDLLLIKTKSAHRLKNFSVKDWNWG